MNIALVSNAKPNIPLYLPPISPLPSPRFNSPKEFTVEEENIILSSLLGINIV